MQEAQAVHGVDTQVQESAAALGFAVTVERGGKGMKGDWASHEADMQV